MTEKIDNSISIPESVEDASVPDIESEFKDVRFLTPFDPNDARYRVPFKWMRGPKKESKNWRHDDTTPDVATMFRRLACHMENESKDGTAFVTGDMAKGQRLKHAVKALYAIGLDFDKGTPPETIDAAMIALGCACIRYTTHSNGKTRDKFKRDDIVKWLRETKQDQESKIDSALMRRYLAEKKGWHESIVGTVEFIDAEHENGGIMVNVSMSPMHKNRVVIPLAAPFEIAKEGGTQNEAIAKWAKVPVAMSELMGLRAALDMTGTDTSRLFYFPRHAKNMPYEVTICGGDLFDWKTLELDAQNKKEDKAPPRYLDAIDALTPESTDRDIEAVAEKILEADLPPKAYKDALSRTKAKIGGLTLTEIRQIVKAVETRLARDAKTKEVEDHGLDLFSYNGEFNFDDAVKKCVRSLKQANTKAGMPMFCHVSGDLVRLNQTDREGRLSFDELSTQALWSELNRRIAFVQTSDTAASARRMVPKEIAAQVWEQGYLELPPAPEILYTPVYTREGNLMVTPGYWPEHDILMADTGFRVNDVPEEPTAEQVGEAVNWLKEEVFGDFPFLDYGLDGKERRDPSEANAFAMLLTPFMRRMITSCTPAFFVTKPTPGTGGTLLAMIPLILFDGIEPTPLRYTKSEEEMQKLVTTAILETRSSMFFDDVDEFNNRVLLMCLTAKHIGGRVLGMSRTVARPNNFLWQATGNNTDIKSEMERRICWIRLNAKTHDIQKRTFRHPNFVQFLLRNRETAVRHILTMIEYWHSVGAPRYTERKRASFEDWSEQVGGVLMVCGVQGFLDNKAAPAQNMDEAAVKDFVRNWLLHYRVERKITPSALFAWAFETDVVSGNNDDQKKARFMKMLPTLSGRTFEIDGDEYMVRSGHDDDGNTAFYIKKVETQDAPADAEASA